MSFKPELQNIEKFKYCPACSKPFRDRKITDIFVKGYECESNHRYFLPVEIVTINETQPEHMRLSSSEQDKAKIAKAWLTERSFRKHLNPQLATMLRACLEIQEKTYSKSDVMEKFIFCPWCSRKVREVPSDDSWVIAKKCSQNHEFKERGYHILFEGCMLEREITYGFLKQCLVSYLNEEEPSKYVPDQLKPVLEYFSKRLSDV